MSRQRMSRQSDDTRTHKTLDFESQQEQTSPAKNEKAYKFLFAQNY
jgi:hypothetical protein